MGRWRNGSVPPWPCGNFRAHSSVGRALLWHRRGQGFESPWVHRIFDIEGVESSNLFRSTLRQAQCLFDILPHKLLFKAFSHKEDPQEKIKQ